MNEFNLMLEELETGKTAIHDKYVVTKNAIVYRNIKRMRAEYVLQQNVCAAKINGTIYGNSSLLDLLANHTKIAEYFTRINNFDIDGGYAGIARSRFHAADKRVQRVFIALSENFHVSVMKIFCVSRNPESGCLFIAEIPETYSLDNAFNGQQ